MNSFICLCGGIGVHVCGAAEFGPAKKVKKSKKPDGPLSEFARAGGLARAAKLTAEQRTGIARKAAQTRWSRDRRIG